MPDNRYTSRLTDRDIYRLFKKGRYTANLETGEIFLASGKPVATYIGNNEGHLYLRLYGFKKRRATAVHRVIWILGAKQSIPKGFEVHHRNKITSDNRWTNLFCLHRRDHAKLHDGPGGDLVDEGIPF